MFKSRLISIAMLGLAFFSGMASSYAKAEDIRRAELEVVAAYLNDHEARLPDGKSWVVEPTSAILSSRFHKNVSHALKKWLPEASKVVIADFVRVEKRSVPFSIPRELVNSDVSFSVADSDFLKELSIGGGLWKYWDRFYARYPSANGLVRFSRVGLDAKAKHGLLYVDYACGARCGSGSIVFLRYESGRWTVIRSKQIWVS